MSAGQFDEAVAYSRIRPFGDEQLTRLFAFALNQLGGNVDFETLREREPADDAAPGPTKEETAALIESLWK